MTGKTTVGLLGLGSRSTVFYLEKLNALYQELNKGYSTFPCVVLNIDFNSINPYLPDKTSDLLHNLKPVIKDLERLAIDHLVVPNITLHETLERITMRTRIIHPVMLCIERLHFYKKKKVTLIGSCYTMNADYVLKAFQKEEIAVETPTFKDQKVIDALRKKVYNRQETEEDLLAFRRLLETYKANSTVIICCTELSVINSEPNNAHSIDMALLQIEKAISLKT